MFLYLSYTVSGFTRRARKALESSTMFGEKTAAQGTGITGAGTARSAGLLVHFLQVQEVTCVLFPPGALAASNRILGPLLRVNNKGICCLATC